jgi:hypothetical protein
MMFAHISGKIYNAGMWSRPRKLLATSKEVVYRMLKFGFAYTRFQKYLSQSL